MTVLMMFPLKIFYVMVLDNALTGVEMITVLSLENYVLHAGLMRMVLLESDHKVTAFQNIAIDHLCKFHVHRITTLKLNG